jgi:hypothetical protein
MFKFDYHRIICVKYNKYHCILRFFLVSSLIVTLFSGLISIISLNTVTAQVRPQAFQVIFDSITVHTNHDWGWGNDGEWHLTAFVNDADVLLSAPGIGLDDIGGEDTKSFHGISVQVPPASEDDLRIQTRGYEDDQEGGVLPTIPYGLDKIPYVNYVADLIDVINIFGGLNPNDGIGVIQERYTGPTWGAGYHVIRSNCNGVDGDSCGDFTLRFMVIPIFAGGVFGGTTGDISEFSGMLGTSEFVPTSHISLEDLDMIKNKLNQTLHSLQSGDVNGTIKHIDDVKGFLVSYINELKLFNMTYTTAGVGVPFTINLEEVVNALNKSKQSLTTDDINNGLQQLNQAISGLGTSETAGLGAVPTPIRGAIANVTSSAIGTNMTSGANATVGSTK